MKNPAFQIRFRGMDPSVTLEAVAREKAAKLGGHCPALAACRIELELRQEPQRLPFAVRIDVDHAGQTLSLTCTHGEDVFAALRHAFEAMREEIEDAGGQQRGREVFASMRRQMEGPASLPPSGSRHRLPLAGEVVRLDEDDRCGFIRTEEGAEFRFGAESLADAPFEQVRLGVCVHFLPEHGAPRRQAERVRLGKRRCG